MTKLVIYTNYQDILITTLENEKNMIEEYFGEDSDRDKEDYEREVLSGKNVIEIDSRTTLDWMKV